MSNTPLPDIVCLWSDNTKLKYSLLTGKTSIFCPHVRTDSLFCDENSKFKKSFSSPESKNFHEKNKNSNSNNSNNNNNNNNNDKNSDYDKRMGSDRKNENENKNKIKRGYYWEGDLINDRSSLSSPFSSFFSTYSPSSTTCSHSLDFVDLNPLPIYLKIYLFIAQKAIKRILKEENDFTCFKSKFTKTTRNDVKNKNKNEILMFPRNGKKTDFHSNNNKNVLQHENDVNEEKKNYERGSCNHNRNNNEIINCNKKSSYPRIFVDHL